MASFVFTSARYDLGPWPEFSTHLVKYKPSTHIFGGLEKSQSVKNCAGNLSDSWSLPVKLSGRHHRQRHRQRGVGSRRYCTVLSVLMNHPERTASPAGLTCPGGRLCICRRKVAEGKVDGLVWVEGRGHSGSDVSGEAASVLGSGAAVERLQPGFGRRPNWHRLNTSTSVAPS
ncbi:hypothetical protein Pcinc_035037 [Petrolisthes cinctipes]|uniref:Uncharacterized protein n=1 Tax=Petrolisthes cinctipes TaxID=88211 RepID=A0AAE1C0J9_PETCI|nr:hypothetical protein Pcinc_035037 [Petrolisthes cinctipes]